MTNLLNVVEALAARPRIARRAFCGGALALSPSLWGAPGKANAESGDAWSPLLIGDDAYILLNVRVRDQACTAFLDTGAVTSLVDEAFASRLNLPVVGQRTLRGFDRAAEFSVAGGFDAIVGAERVRIEGAARQSLDLISSSLGRPVQMILGHDLFSGRLIELDLPASRWRVTPRTTIVRTGRRIALRFGAHGEPIIQVSIEGRPPILAVLDLGASSALTLSRAYAEQSGLLTGKRVSSAAIAGVNGVSTSTSVMMRSLILAGESFRALPSEVLDAWLAPEVPAVVGLPVLSRFRVTLDFDGHCAWLAADRSLLRAKFREDHSGLGVAYTGDRLRVVHVAAQSPAAKGGWREGEEIVAINGRAVRQVYADERTRSWRTQPPGSRVTLTLSTGEARRVTLTDYY